MNKKKLMLFGLPILALALVTAGLLTYYGQIQQKVNVEQAVIIEGCVDNVCEEDVVNGWTGDTFSSEVYTLKNLADSPRIVTLTTEYPTGDALEVDTSYLGEVEYSYSETWSENGDVLVTVVDTDDGWLEWTYTAIDPATTKLKMTVEINFPTGFGITTFDDGSHDGWYYYDSSGVVRISDYDGTSKIPGYDWVETSYDADSMTVRIKKSSLPNTFKWHGFANFHRASNWINAPTGSSCEPEEECASATIMESLTLPITLDADSSIDFVIVNEINELSDGVSGLITTEVLPA